MNINELFSSIKRVDKVTEPQTITILSKANMKTQAIVVLATFWAFFVVVKSQEDRQVYCGRRLAVALAYYCRTGVQPLGNGAIVRRYERGLPWQRKASVQQRKGRRKRQVVYECCLNSCSKEQLLTYCS